MSDYKLKTPKVGKPVVDACKKVEQGFTNAFLEKDESSKSGYTLKPGKVGNAVIDAYKSVEDHVVGGYKKIEDAFVERFLEKVEPKQAVSGDDEAEGKISSEKE